MNKPIRAFSLLSQDTVAPTASASGNRNFKSEILVAIR